MSRDLSDALKAQLFAQNSNDPFLSLLTLTHESFAEDIHLVNNTVEIISNGITFHPFPMKITLPTDDGESLREVVIELDNVSQELIDELRSITGFIDVNLQMVLASNPDFVEVEISELKIRNINYNVSTIQANLFMDDFLNTELTSERYNPTNFPGIFS